jgi:hypothetical protein
MKKSKNSGGGDTQTKKQNDELESLSFKILEKIKLS